MYSVMVFMCYLFFRYDRILPPPSCPINQPRYASGFTLKTVNNMSQWMLHLSHSHPQLLAFTDTHTHSLSLSFSLSHTVTYLSHPVSICLSPFSPSVAIFCLLTHFLSPSLAFSTTVSHFLILSLSVFCPLSPFSLPSSCSARSLSLSLPLSFSSFSHSF